MTLQERLPQEIRAAMLARDADRLSALRMLKSAIGYAQIERKTENLSDAEFCRDRAEGSEETARFGRAIREGRPARAGGEGKAGNRRAGDVPAPAVLARRNWSSW